MKLKITESQAKRLPLLSENVADSPIIKIFYKSVGEAKERLNSLFLKLTAYSIHDVVTGNVGYSEISDMAEAITNKIDAMGARIEAQLQSVSDDDYDRLGYGDIENDVHSAKFDVYYKADLISDMCSDIGNLQEMDHKVNEYFSDIKTLDA
jgi:hypothetical protein